MRTTTELNTAGIQLRNDGSRKTAMDAIASGAGDDALFLAFPWLNETSGRVLEQLRLTAMYAGYVRRQNAEIRQMRAQRDTSIPQGLAFASLPGLSTEAKEALTSRRPSNLAEAERLSGVDPAMMTVIRKHVRR